MTVKSSKIPMSALMNTDKRESPQGDTPFLQRVKGALTILIHWCRLAAERRERGVVRSAPAAAEEAEGRLAAQVTQRGRGSRPAGPPCRTSASIKDLAKDRQSRQDQLQAQDSLKPRATPAKRDSKGLRCDSTRRGSAAHIMQDSHPALS